LSPTDLHRVDLLAIIDRQVDNLVRLVDDLLEVSRISSGKIVLDKQLIDIASVIRTAVETSQPIMDAAGHNLTISLPPGRIIVEADPLRLSQIIANLLNNAAKYTDGSGQVWLTVSRDKDHLQISVRDNGVGIANEMLPHVFGMFSQLDRDHKRAQGGLGIGLALVKTLVKLHDGSVEARSAGLGKGSEFIVTLPLTPRCKEVEPADDIAESGSETVSVNRILVVDDNADAASALALLLETLGNRVQVAHNGSAALAQLEGYRPNVMFLDLGMPDMSGYEVAQKIGENPAYDNVTLIALTGWGQDEDCRRSKEAGFRYHLVKPIRLSTVKEILSKIER
jgi:CheY-like chemotaxis protein